VYIKSSCSYTKDSGEYVTARSVVRQLKEL
jgi:hypothetical protein